MQVKKWEVQKLATLKHLHFYFHFLPYTIGSSEAEFLNQSQRQIQIQNLALGDYS